MSRVLAGTDAQRDQDHIRLLVDHNPGVPDRHRAIAQAGQTSDEPGVGLQLADMARGLESAGADFLVMVCNTAHAWSVDIRAAVDIPFVSIVDVTVAALGDAPRSVGVMAAEGCLRAGLYQEALAQAGHQPILWSESELSRFMDLVYRIKAGEGDPGIGGAMGGLAASLEFAGADVLIAGCTEIPLVLDADALNLPLLSSTDLLVEHTIALARGDSPLPHD
jgi:aspartate racemase